MKKTGKIIPLAFPDVFVKLSDEKRLRLFRWVGIGTKTHIKAGHAALVLVDDSSKELHYFDFGRYVTPNGKGRVRSKKTDIEVHIPLKAEFDKDGNIKNIKDILIWLQSNPQKTHGGGRMIASVGEIDFDKAFGYLKSLQDKGSIPYKAFGAGQKGIGTNCSRIVTETLLKGISDQKLHKRLNFNKRFTPSPLGNVEITAKGGDIYSVEDGKVFPYKSSAFKENLVNFFDKTMPKDQVHVPVSPPNNTDHLDGIGSSAYFKIEGTPKPDTFKITRYNDLAEEDFSGEFKTDQTGFDLNKNHQFVYDSNCRYCHIEQDGQCYRFDLVVTSEN